MDADDAIREALEPYIKSAKRLGEAADAVAETLKASGFPLLDDGFETVEVHNSRVAVETTEVGGLTISLDAGGNAVQVTSPYGLEIVE